ncbi:hypothetical protein [Parachryseolinea silvisoli]|uniref:hypothetical protein n=1 Tax=Parachryseolinea silvisoli TaxID=2873601 RepID=UPI002265C075|nr:hypothetical protein [Parachryseolinea silvisoli]MCD9015894.1 hypothetical protein [Parachryseolinea silvisoli]
MKIRIVLFFCIMLSARRCASQQREYDSAPREARERSERAYDNARLEMAEIRGVDEAMREEFERFEAKQALQGSALQHLLAKEQVKQMILTKFDSLHPALKAAEIKGELEQSISFSFVNRTSEEQAIRSAKILNLQRLLNDLTEQIIFLGATGTEDQVKRAAVSIDDGVVKIAFLSVRDSWIRISTLRDQLSRLEDKYLSRGVIDCRGKLCNEISLVHNLIPVDFTSTRNDLSRIQELRDLLERFSYQYFQRSKPNAGTLSKCCVDLFVQNILQSNLIVPETVQPQK